MHTHTLQCLQSCPFYYHYEKHTHALKLTILSIFFLDHTFQVVISLSAHPHSLSEGGCSWNMTIHLSISSVTITQSTWTMPDTTRRANAQMTHIHHTHRSSLKSSPSHDQPQQLPRLLQQTDGTNTGFHVTPWPWVKIKIIHSDIKTSSLIRFTILTSLREIGS